MYVGVQFGRSVGHRVSPDCHAEVALAGDAPGSISTTAESRQRLRGKTIYP